MKPSYRELCLYLNFSHHLVRFKWDSEKSSWVDPKGGEAVPPSQMRYGSAQNLTISSFGDPDADPDPRILTGTIC
jgi:hypothetical protein